MRIAPRLLRLVASLPFVACPFSVFALLTPTTAWCADNNGITATAPGQGSFRYLTPVPRAAQPHWTSGTAASRTASGAPMVDPAVQQAGWSNPGPTRGSAPAVIPTSGSQQRGSGESPGRRGPMFRGYELNLPTAFFGRTKGNKNAPASPGNTRASAQPFAGARPMPARQPNATQAPPTTNSPAQSGMAWSRPNIATTSPTAQPNARLAQAPNAALPIPASPSTTQARTAVSAMPTLAAEATPPTADKPSAKASPSLAEQLATQAHEWSATATTDADFTRIIETCRRVRASQPNAPVVEYTNQLTAWALNRRGQLKAEAGRIKEAMLDFDDAIRVDSKCWRATHNRGVLLAQEGQFEKAFDDFNNTIANNPEFAKAYSNRGALLVVAGDLPTALEDYGQAIALDPNLAIAHRGRGRVCHLLGRLDEAIGHYDAAVQLAPDDAYAIAIRADLLTDLGRYVDANDGYNLAIETDPELADAYAGSAWLLATCPDNSIRSPELAIERANKAIELCGKNDAVSFDTLAAAQACAGDFNAAAQSVRQAIKLASNEERDVYRDRLVLYQHAKPYRIAPMREVTQASYESKGE